MTSNDYLNGLLQSVQDTFPNIIDIHVLKTLFPSLFLALVARDTNIILNTPQPAELQKSTAKILSTVFGLPIKRIKVRTPQSPHQLIESFFISTSLGPSSASSHKRRRSGTGLARSISAPRPTSSHLTDGSDRTFPGSTTSRLPRHRTDPLPLFPNPDSEPGLHLPQVVVITGLERASRAAQLALAEVLRTRRVTLDTVIWNLPDGFFIVYVSSVGDGYERPSIHSSLLDHFAFSTTLPHAASSISTSSPSPKLRPLSISTPNNQPPLLPFDRLPYPESSHISPLVSHYINALLTGARHHPELDGTFLTVRCVKDVEKLVRASSLVFREDEHMTISDMHVRRVIPPILVHRLRVRDGPREQILGILWEGAGIRNWGKHVEGVQPARRTIQAILAEIMAEV